MSNRNTTARELRPEDLVPVRSRISWSAVLAGAAIALAMHFLLSLLGAAVGLSIRDQVDLQNLKLSAAAYAIGVTALCLFVGGYVASILTVGENPSESLLYGVLVWAVVFAGILSLAAGGIRTGFGAMSSLATAGNAVATQTAGDWEDAARRAGVPQARVAEWQEMAKNAPQAGRQAVEDPQNRETAANAITRATWYTFFGAWISMLAAALGGYVGAGPLARFFSVPVVIDRNAAVPA